MSTRLPILNIQVNQDLVTRLKVMLFFLSHKYCLDRLKRSC